MNMCRGSSWAFTAFKKSSSQIPTRDDGPLMEFLCCQAFSFDYLQDNLYANEVPP